MAGARSERHRQEKDARDTYNNRRRAPVQERDKEKEKKLTEQFGDDGNISNGDPRKTKKMKAMWVIILLVLASGCIVAAYMYNKNKNSEAIADDAIPRIERTTTPAVKATPTKPEPKEVKAEVIEEPTKPQPRKSEYEDEFWSHLSDPRWTGSKDPANMSVEEVCEYTNFVADHFGF